MVKKRRDFAVHSNADEKNVILVFTVMQVKKKRDFTVHRNADEEKT